LEDLPSPPCGWCQPVYDPSQPILPVSHRLAHSRAIAHSNQRQRRAVILASIRRLLLEQGLEGVTVRRIAEHAGLAVQTIYNLVGPREHAIIEAISEYTRWVGQTAKTDPRDPNAVVEIIDSWLQSISAAPEFCRQVSLIFFSDARCIFYAYRDRQMKGMQGLLTRQQKCGVLREDANVRDLAEQLVLLATALCVEWSDRPFPLEQLHRRLCSGYSNLLLGTLNPASLRPRWPCEGWDKASCEKESTGFSQQTLG
jgi:AcrR family transcriptional regulator